MHIYFVVDHATVWKTHPMRLSTGLQSVENRIITWNAILHKAISEQYVEIARVFIKIEMPDFHSKHKMWGIIRGKQIYRFRLVGLCCVDSRSDYQFVESV